MNKKLVIILLGLFISNTSFPGIIKGKGQKGPLEVIEIGPNVKANIVSKIEQTRNTLESIQQTKNQILQLKNDALNLSKWTDTALQETLGISQADIQNIKEIQRLSGSLYNDVKNFEANWKKEFGMDFEKMDINQLGNAQNKLSNRIDEIKKNIIREGNDLSNKAAELEKNVTLFNSKNRQVTGNLEVAQLGNEIMTSVLSSINSLNATLINQEAKRQELEMKEAEKQKAKNEIAKKRYLIETQRVIQNTETDVITIK